MARKESKYKMRDDAVNRGREQASGNRGGGALNIGDTPFWKPTKRIHRLRVIPYIITQKGDPSGFNIDDIYQQLAYKVHFSIGAEQRAVFCPTTIGQKCPLCERYAELRKATKADKDEMDEVKPKDRVAFNVLDLDNEDAGLQVFDYSLHNFAKILYDEADLVAETEDNFNKHEIFDPVNGFDFKVKFKEKKIGQNSFMEATSVEFLDRDPIDDRDIEDALDLFAAASILSYKEIETLWIGVGGDDDHGDEDRGRGGKRGRERSSSRSSSRNRDEGDGDDRGSQSRSRGSSRQQQEPPDDDKDQEPDRGSRSRSRSSNDKEPDEGSGGRSRSRSRSRDDDKEPDRGKKDDSNDKNEPEDGECPHGFTFGTDCERHNECDSCDLWSECNEAKDNQSAGGKSGGRRGR